jgi:hypothetical protein
MGEALEAPMYSHHIPILHIDLLSAKRCQSCCEQQEMSTFGVSIRDPRRSDPVKNCSILSVVHNTALNNGDANKHEKILLQATFSTSTETQGNLWWKSY